MAAERPLAENRQIREAFGFGIRDQRDSALTASRQACSSRWVSSGRR
jgi:hypothetical protein